MQGAVEEALDAAALTDLMVLMLLACPPVPLQRHCWWTESISLLRLVMNLHPQRQGA
jgi:hypothetical protein